MKLTFHMAHCAGNDLRCIVLGCVKIAFEMGWIKDSGLMKTEENGSQTSLVSTGYGKNATKFKIVKQIKHT